MESILVVDDEPGIRTAIQEVLSSDELRVLVAGDEETGLKQFVDASPLVVLLDIRLGLDSGLETFRRIRQIDPRALVVFITGHGTTELAIESMKLGAFDYLVKPLDIDQLKAVVDQGIKISRTMRAPATVSSSDYVADDSDRIVGNSRIMQSICKIIGKIAPQDINVLILGESGTGKDLIARAIYHHSRRNQATYLAINCAAIPESLLESELFGHEQGAFTGADRQRIGKFEQCNRGTIFLDEIGDMPLATQAKMLRLLQDGDFQRVGGNETLHSDVRIIAATHQKLEEMIEKGRFRRDLYYRLRGVSLHLPALRDRVVDISELAHYFLFRINQQLGTHVDSISEPAIEKLCAYNWPGNIRELQSVIREALITSTGPTLLEEFLPDEVCYAPISEPQASIELLSEMGPQTWLTLGITVERSIESQSRLVYREALLEFDRLIIHRALTESHGNQGKAADLLGISRPTLRAKLRALVQHPDDSEEDKLALVSKMDQADAYKSATENVASENSIEGP